MKHRLFDAKNLYCRSFYLESLFHFFRWRVSSIQINSIQTNLNKNQFGKKVWFLRWMNQWPLQNLRSYQVSGSVLQGCIHFFLVLKDVFSDLYKCQLKARMCHIVHHILHWSLEYFSMIRLQKRPAPDHFQGRQPQLPNRQYGPSLFQDSNSLNVTIS